MAQNIAHRGPDDSGTWVDTQRRIAMSFRRLSIQDLSQHGHQPMSSRSDRWVICFNGEIYNFKSLRQRLSASGHKFVGGSDTEVILAGIEEWGVLACVAELVGMFAIALWDRREHDLWLIRDRFGVKPLYFGYPDLEVSSAGDWSLAAHSGPFYFGSELKALRAAWGAAPRVDLNVLSHFLRYQYVAAPSTLWRGIQKLRPGHFVRFSASSARATSGAYWSALDVLATGSQQQEKRPVEAVIDELQSKLDVAVSERMIADVPLGAFLSGGVDSAAVVAAMRRSSSQTIKTFTIGSDDSSLDESDEAERLARHLGTEHHSLRAGFQDAAEPILKLGDLADEPLGDASFIPTYLVSKLAKQHVSVVLSGDGGDEVFAGYPQHRFAPLVWRYRRRLPQFIGRGAVTLGLDPGTLQLRSFADRALQMLPPQRAAETAARLSKMLRVMAAADRVDFMARWRNAVPTSARFLAHETESEPSLLPFAPRLGEVSSLRGECWADLVSYMPDDILLKVDRASMAVSLEAREPLLDHRLFEFVATLPDDCLIRNGTGKWILRQLLYRDVPRSWVDGPKKGFAVPIAAWVTGPLRDWAEDLLSEHTLREQGYWNVARVRAAWLSHVSPRGRPLMPFYGIWSILSFQSWLRRWN